MNNPKRYRRLEIPLGRRGDGLKRALQLEVNWVHSQVSHDAFLRPWKKWERVRLNVVRLGGGSRSGVSGWRLWIYFRKLQPFLDCYLTWLP